MTIPDSAIKYILLQRTTYCRFPKAKLYQFIRKILPRSTYYNQLVTIEALCGKNRIKQLYQSDMQNEYNSIKNCLPKTCHTVLDIGCGVAGIDVFIQRHYDHNEVDFLLLDKSRLESRIFYGFRRKGEFYNSLSVAKNLLSLNGIPESNILVIESTDTNEININEQIEFAISLYSWGFHYPISTYLEKVYELLSNNGRLVLDVRKNSDGIKLLKNKFGNCEIVDDYEKHARVLCIK